MRTEHEESPKRRTLLITGGTRGLGRRTAQAIAAARDGWLVVITGRSPGAVARTAAGLGHGVVGHPALADTSGRYFSGTREIRSSEESYDRAKAADLWETSVALTG